MTYRIRLHPSVDHDLMAIATWITEHADAEAATRRLSEISDALDALAQTPHKGSTRDEIAPGLRAIPAGRKAVIAFTVDDDHREVLVLAISYGGADWMSQVHTRT